jgi:tetratricopeptide (TPR) repeat protein
MKATSADLNELMSICRDAYQGNEEQLSLVREFKNEYSSDQAVEWYTRDSFVYRMLNKALRVQNIHLIFLFRFLIRDLKKQLEKNQCRSRLTVYRGQFMWNEELESLKRSTGKLISINSFLSTSRDRESAYSFLLEPNKLERVLFEIDADPQLDGVKPFADISQLSFYRKELEVLFMLGSIFRIDTISHVRTGVWTIKLTLCSDRDLALKGIFNHMKSEDKHGELDLVRLGDVLQRMGKYDEAEKYYSRCLKELSPNDCQNISVCNYALGRIANNKGKYERALEYFHTSLKIDMKILQPDDPTIANTYNSIANIYQTKGDCKRALESYNKALTIFQRTLGESHPHVAMCLNNIGSVYQREEEYSEALNYYQNALKIRTKHLPSNHPDLGASHNNIGTVYRRTGRSDQALEEYKLALEIYESSLPSDHSDIAMTLENIGIVYEEKRKWKDALSYYKKAEAIYHQALDSTHPDVVNIEQSVQRMSSKPS